MQVYFTSDTHFGDHRVLNICKRPFATVADMDAELIRRWNEVVRGDDEVWHLGDFARSSAKAAEILPRLNGRKHLLVGNNDAAPSIGQGWETVSAYRELECEGRDLVLCHYPFRSWNRQHRGAINLHGHSHGRLAPLARQYDVGVDARDFRPIRLADLLKCPPVLS